MASITTTLPPQPTTLVQRKFHQSPSFRGHKKSSSFSATLGSLIIDEDGYINLEAFIENMEARLNKLAGYGLESLGKSFESSIDTHELGGLYSRMVSLKNSLVSGGIEKAESLVNVLETHCHDLYDAASQAATELSASDELCKDLTVESPTPSRSNSVISSFSDRSAFSSSQSSLETSFSSDSDINSHKNLNFQLDTTLKMPQALDSTSVTEKALKGLHYIESKLSDLETLCNDSLYQAELLNHSVQSAIRAAKNRLLTYEELPHPWRENPYIRRGYRFCEKYTDCAISVVTLHNETCNIWTHLVGLVIMILLAFLHYPTTLSWTSSNWSDKLTMITFLVAAAKCLFCSTVWHTCNGISHAGQKQRWACVDYTGITVLIAASIITTEYSAFYCNPRLQLFYISITAVFGLFGALFTWHPSFDTPEAKNTRVAFFVSFAGAGVMGFLHACFLRGFADTYAFYAPVFKSLMFYAFGVVFYALFFPERFFPLKIFDYFGMSHNIWHVCVFGGIFFHYTATVKLLEGAREYAGCPA